MPDEILDVIDKSGNVLGNVLRKEAHRKGLLHRTEHVWFENNEGEILIQKRGDKSGSYEGLWDISAAGHIPAGQKPIEAALREIEEEVGIKIKEDDLMKIGEILSYAEIGSTYKNNELQDIYIFKTDKKIDDFKIDYEEVAALKYLKPAKLKQALIESPGLFVPHPQEYDLLFKYLKA